MEEYEKPTQYAYHALLDVDSAHFSRAPRNSSRLWTQDLKELSHGFRDRAPYYVIS